MFGQGLGRGQKVTVSNSSATLQPEAPCPRHQLTFRLRTETRSCGGATDTRETVPITKGELRNDGQQPGKAIFAVSQPRGEPWGCGVGTAGIVLRDRGTLGW